jgi:hypothetical protein
VQKKSRKLPACVSVSYNKAPIAGQAKPQTGSDALCCPTCFSLSITDDKLKFIGHFYLNCITARKQQSRKSRIRIANLRELREYLALQNVQTFSHPRVSSERLAWNAGPLPGLAQT